MSRLLFALVSILGGAHAGRVAPAEEVLQLLPDCEQITQAALHSIVEWDRAQLSELLASAVKGRQSRQQLCGKLGLPVAEPSKPSPVATLVLAMGSVRGCAAECEAGAPCADSLRQFELVALMACVGMRMLECDGGLTPELQSSCELLDATHSPALLGAVRGVGFPMDAGAPAPMTTAAHDTSMMPRTSAQLFLALMVAVPMVAFIFSRFTPPRTPSERIYPLITARMRR